MARLEASGGRVAMWNKVRHDSVSWEPKAEERRVEVSVNVSLHTLQQRGTCGPLEPVASSRCALHASYSDLFSLLPCHANLCRDVVLVPA